MLFYNEEDLTNGIPKPTFLNLKQSKIYNKIFVQLH